MDSGRGGVALQDTSGSRVDPAAAPASVLVVGAASRDISPDDSRGWRLGGGVAYSTLTLARLGVPVRALIGVDSEAATAWELDLLREAGAEVTLAPLPKGPVFENIDSPAGRRQRTLSASAALGPALLPVGWGNAAGVLYAPVAGEIGDGWAAVPGPGARVALGWQGLLRSLVPGRDVARRAPSASPLVHRADLIGVSREDLDPEARIDDLIALLAPSASLVITGSDSGGLVVGPERAGRRRWRRYPAIKPDAVVDATGAGDTFLAALLARRISGVALVGVPSAGSELRLAAAVASLSVEGLGLLGVPDLPAVLERMDRAAKAR